MLKPLLLATTLALGLLAPTVEANERPSLEPLLQEELQRLENALQGRMGIALFRTDDPVIRGFIASGVLRVPQEAYLRLESGLAAVAVLNGKHNGQNRPMCYVLFNPSRAGPVERSSFIPIAQATGDARQGAAYLAAHETAHCIDHLEREGLLAKKMQWTPEEAVTVGIQPDAFARVFGAKASTAAYRTRLNDLYADLAQRQYEERVADAFGILWVWRLGGSDEVQRIIREVRGRDNPKNAHYTAPILDALPVLKPKAIQASSIDEVWGMARGTQRQIGIDPILGANSTVWRNPLADALQQAKKNNKPTPATPPRTKAWNELPRFGAPQNP